MRWLLVLAEFVLVPVFAVAAVWCWRNGIHTGWFKPSGDAPGFDATRYSGPWLSGAAVLVVVAGLVLIDTVAKVVRARGQ
ncbi:hypothetical protein AB0N05_04140 [Nocardia sp. NPDC051030]|uniref:hypothetical protein n=1 Tax=Nocardia sp. NPDC051030 TaxID=3155162 RepID=UPI00342C6F8B